MPNYSREYLIEICEKAIVPVERWNNWGTPHAQQSVGRCWALLKAGCEFEVDAKETTEETIWLNINTPTFNTFEYGEEDGDFNELESFYLPTEKRLKDRGDRDWY